MAISTNGLQLARIAGAVFNQQLSASDYSEILAANKTAAELDAWANAAVAAEFRNKTTTDIAKAVLANVGLSSVAGLEAWVAGQLTAGGGVAKAGATMLAMLNDFSNMTADATYGAAATTFNQKAANSQALSQTAGTAGGTYAAVSTTAAPTIFPLSTGADVKTTGSGADTFNALYSSTSGMTFGTNDILDGGAGADSLFVQVGATGVHGPATLSNIETVSTNFSAAGTVNLLGAAGVTTVESNGSSEAAAFTNIGSATTAMRVANTANSANFGFTTAAVAGSADTASVALNAVTAGTLTLTSGFETLSLTSSGSANTLTGLSTGTATIATVKVGGDQALNIGTVATAVTLPTTVTNFDASANTASGAGVVATFGASTTATSITGGAGNDTFVITNISGTVNAAGGAGNDTFIDGRSSLRTTDTITGGDGTADVLVATAEAAQAYATPSTRTITGIERLQLQTPGTTGVTLTTANVDTGIATVTMGAGTATVASGIGAAAAFAATSGAYGITGPAGTLAVNLGGTLGGALTLTDTGTAITDSATVTVSQSTATANVLAGQNIVNAGYETLTISSGTTANSTTQTLGTVATTVDTGGASVVNFTGVNNLSVGAITAVTVSASGMTGAATFTQTAAAGATTTSITGTSNNDVIRGGSAASTLTGNAGNDSIVAGAGNDSLSGGDGADTMEAGAGKDTLTGGSGADYFQFGTANTSTVVQSSSAAADTITDFLSGTDKIQITGQTVSAFLGNYTSLQAALAAAGGRTNQAVFISGENNLYVIANGNGSSNPAVLAATDTVITLSGVTSLVAADLLLGAQGTGSSITVTTAAANLSNTSSTGATAATTTADDAVSSTVTLAAGATTIDGGFGNDTLSITGAGGALNLATVANVEVLDLSAATSAVTVTNASTAFTRYSLSAFGDTVTTSATASSVTGGALNDSIAGGAGNDTLIGGDGNDSLVSGGGNDSLSAGAGEDSIRIASPASTNTSTVSGGAGADVLSITGSADADITGLVISTTETLNINAENAARAYTMTPAQLAAFTSGTTVTTITTPSNITFTLDATTTAKATGTITVDADVQKYTVATGAVAGVTINGIADSTVAFSVTGGDGADTINFGTHGAANQSIAGGAGADTITLLGSSVDGNDAIDGGSGTDQLVLAGTAAVSTGNLGSGFTNLETITTQQTTNAVSIVFNNAANVTSTGMTVNGTSLTTGALTVTGLSTDTDPFTVNGGGGDDSITGGAGNDSLTSGSGSDTVTGGAGADTISTGANNDSVDGGIGNDTIDTGTGSDVIAFAASTYGVSDAAAAVVTATTWSVDTVSAAGFDRTVDSLRFSAGQLNSVATSQFQVTLSDGKAGSSISAADAIASTDIAINATTDLTGLVGVSNFLRLTNTTGTSFATAIGTGSLTTTGLSYATNNATEGLLASWYDSTNSQAVFGFILDTNTATANRITGADTFIEIVRIGITSADYTSGISIGTFLS